MQLHEQLRLKSIEDNAVYEYEKCTEIETQSYMFLYSPDQMTFRGWQG